MREQTLALKKVRGPGPPPLISGFDAYGWQRYDTYSTVGFVLEELWWYGQNVWVRFSYDFLHEFLVVGAVRSGNVDFFVLDVFRVEYPSNIILLPFDLNKKTYSCIV